MQPDESPHIAIDDVVKHLQSDQFWAIRAKAIQSYAMLEQSLCFLFSHVGDMDRQVAGIIFFKIASADARVKIIEKLFRRKFGEEFRPFINCLVAQLRPIDIKRNQIVHWNASNIIGGPDPRDWSLVLIPPNYFQTDTNFPRVETLDLLGFTQECGFYSRIINMFCASTHPEHGANMGVEAERWKSVFNKPIAYPPQGDHPFAGQYL